MQYVSVALLKSIGVAALPIGGGWYEFDLCTLCMPTYSALLAIRKYRGLTLFMEPSASKTNPLQLCRSITADSARLSAAVKIAYIAVNVGKEVYGIEGM
jgi:hypothetical protein